MDQQMAVGCGLNRSPSPNKHYLLVEVLDVTYELCLVI
jgi:hypothetical protein